jgi:hypothetical protein
MNQKEFELKRLKKIKKENTKFFNVPFISYL